jgi:hypothetical protein
MQDRENKRPFRINLVEDIKRGQQRNFKNVPWPWKW